MLTQALAFLHDHIVAGGCIAPGAVFFEMAALAGRPLYEDGLQNDHKTLAATACTIPAPLLLLDPEAGASPIVSCDIDSRSRAVRVASEGGKPNCARPAPMVTHLTANLALVLPATEVAAAAGSGEVQMQAVHRALRPIARRLRRTAEIASAAADRGMAEGDHVPSQGFESACAIKLNPQQAYTSVLVQLLQQLVCAPQWH